MSDQNPPEQGAFGSPAPGSPAPGSPAPGSPAPGSPTPGPVPGGPGPEGGAAPTPPAHPTPPAPASPSAPPTPPVNPAGTGGPGAPGGHGSGAGTPPPPGGSTPAGPPSHGHGGQAAFTAAGDALADSSAGFFPALFDFTFNTFVTPKIVRFVYVLAVIWAVVSYVFAVVAGFASSVGTGFVVLILGPIFAVIWLAVVRIGLEFGISVVRMSEDVHRRLPQA